MLVDYSPAGLRARFAGKPSTTERELTPRRVPCRTEGRPHVLWVDGHEGSVDPLVCCVWMDMKAVLVLSCAVCGWTRRQC